MRATPSTNGVERAPGVTLRRFFALTYGTTLLVCFQFLSAIARPDLRTSVFGVLVWLTYPLVYGAPAWILTWLASRAVAVGGRWVSTDRWGPALVRAVAVGTSAATLGLLCIDAAVYDLYGFHVNGFVVNLVTTPGGIESMDAGASTYRTCTLYGVAILAWQLLLMWWAARGRDRRAPFRFARLRSCVLALVLLSITERIAYGVAHAQAHLPTLAAADAFPLYSRLTFNTLARSMGFEVRRRTGIDVSGDFDSPDLRYPLAPLDLAAPERPLNVVWIVSESLRADALDEATMPRTWDFAQKAQRFEHHYSGGNGTRMGVFSMFYGLYGTYWFPMLNRRRGPVLVDALIDQDYQFCINTSARFTYPEFDSTIWVDLPAEALHEWREGESWERDRVHVDSILAFLDARDRSRPFMTFSFFESPHARYAFPKACAVHQPYLEDFNYASMDLARDIELIRNRYLNSCFHLDSQVARLLDYLEREDLLESTLVVITGDHGEEFLEKGHWGHGSSFVEEQIRVPLVLWVPGLGARTVGRMTSHVDLPATLLPLLGVLNPPEELSLGHDLLGPEGEDQVVIADWSRLCIRTEEVKASFPFKVSGAFRTETTGADDEQIDGPQAILPVRHLSEVLRGLARFRHEARTSSDAE